MRSVKYKGSTLPEMLIVIILSGILFLLLFDGMNIIHKYNLMLSTRLTTKNELFYSHSILELIMEETDSIRMSDGELKLLFYKAGEVKQTMSLSNECFHVLYNEMQDSLFINNLGWELQYRDENKIEIDSIVVITSVDNDTLKLRYGLSAIYNILNAVE